MIRKRSDDSIPVGPPLPAINTTKDIALPGIADEDIALPNTQQINRALRSPLPGVSEMTLEIGEDELRAAATFLKLMTKEVKKEEELMQKEVNESRGMDLDGGEDDDGGDGGGDDGGDGGGDDGGDGGGDGGGDDGGSKRRTEMEEGYLLARTTRRPAKTDKEEVHCEYEPLILPNTLDSNANMDEDTAMDEDVPMDEDIPKGDPFEVRTSTDSEEDISMSVFSTVIHVLCRNIM